MEQGDDSNKRSRELLASPRNEQNREDASTIPLHDQGRQYLCQRCKAIDFDSLLENVKWIGLDCGYPVQTLGRVCEWDLARSALCRFFADAGCDIGDGKAAEESEYELWFCVVAVNPDIWTADTALTRTWIPPGTVVAALIENTSSLTKAFTMGQFHILDKDYVYPMKVSTLKPIFSVLNAKVEFKRVGLWMTHCVRYHELDCNRFSTEPAPFLKVIDCRTTDFQRPAAVQIRCA